MAYIHIVVIFALSALCLADCFWRNGARNPSTEYQPCNNDSSNPLHTICCASWDSCLPNGLCLADTGLYWRESCIHSNWDEGGCQELCSSEESQRVTDTIVTPCDGSSTSTTWCCGDNADCCSPGSENPRYTIAERFGDPIQTPSSSVSLQSGMSSIVTPSEPFGPSGTAAGTASTTPASPNDAKDKQAGDFSTGAKAGIGVGAAVGAITLVGLGIFLAKALMWKRASLGSQPLNGNHYQAVPPTAGHYGYSSWDQPELKQVPAAESQASAPLEMPTRQ